VLQRVPGVYRSGEGLPYPEYGADCRLEADGTRVLDVGCGIGWSSISLARAFPSLRVDGIDADEASIAEAQRLAAEAGFASLRVLPVDHVFWRFYQLAG
jgi:2-polyprenyl-3-methyl-5-hydroxy-6-metoxy-1,4-benzoquinol methylase